MEISKEYYDAIQKRLDGAIVGIKSNRRITLEGQKALFGYVNI